jgi:hypothetical protein
VLGEGQDETHRRSIARVRRAGGDDTSRLCCCLVALSAMAERRSARSRSGRTEASAQPPYDASPASAQIRKRTGPPVAGSDTTTQALASRLPM